ncbi:glutamyl-tRNA reductase [Propionibacteriaceae bacterium Y1923]
MLLALTASHAEVSLGRLADLSAAMVGVPDRLAAHNQAHPNVPLVGWVVLSTCNRVELYIEAQRFHDGLDVAVAALADVTGWDRPTLITSFEVRTGTPVAEHLFRVAAGLESVVLGEAEITGQVRAAFNDALHEQTTTTALNELFQQALRTAKRVASTTPVGRAGRSSAEVVLDTAAQALGSGLHGARVLVIGSGAYSRVVAAELALRRVGDVGVHSPSGRRPGSVDSYAFTHVVPGELDEWLRTADVVIACSGRGRPVVTAVQVARRGARPLVVMDVALQSDVEPAVAGLPGVQVLGLTSLAVGLSDVSQEALAQATRVIAEGVARFETRLNSRRADPVVVGMRRYVHGLIKDEVDGLRGRLDEQTVSQVEQSLRRVYRKVLHAPTVTAQAHAAAGRTEAYLQALHTVMGIDMANVDAVAVIDAEALPMIQDVEVH